MKNNDLRTLLHQLDDEIRNTHKVDEKGSELLRNLEVDINTLLERSGENPVYVHPSVAQRFEDALSYFEVTHPKLTAVISKLLESLSNAGV
ncbi:MAG: DUF4404 family protein [Anaerolineales bacterium]